VRTSFDRSFALHDYGHHMVDHVRLVLAQGRPGGFTGGGAWEAMVSQVDLFPTICELLEVEPPRWLQGRSMVPLIRGEAEQNDDRTACRLASRRGCWPGELSGAASLQVARKQLPGACMLWYVGRWPPDGGLRGLASSFTDSQPNIA